MAQNNIIRREQSVRVGLESAFGVTPSGTFPNAMTRIITTDEIKGDGATREMLDSSDIRARRMDAIQPIQGLEIGSKVMLKAYLKATPSASQLTSSAAPGSLTPRVLLTHALGTEHAAAGSTVATGTSATQFDVASGHGSRFKKGTLIAVEISSAMEWALVTNISTDTLTVSPALSGTPSTSAIVRNLYNYAPAESHSNSLTVQAAYVGDSAAQVTFNGCHGGIAFDFGEFGKLTTMSLDLTAASNTLGAQSIPTTVVSDEMGSAFALTPQVYVAAASAPTRGTTLTCEKFSMELPSDWKMVRDPSATQTVAAVVNAGGRPRVAKLNVSVRFDSDYWTAFDAETRYSIAIVQRIGSGTTASFWIWQMNNAKLTAQPKLVDIGDRLHMDLEFSPIQDDAVTVGGSTGTDLDHIYAPYRVAFG